MIVDYRCAKIRGLNTNPLELMHEQPIAVKAVDLIFVHVVKLDECRKGVRMEAIPDR